MTSRTATERGAGERRHQRQINRPGRDDDAVEGGQRPGLALDVDAEAKIDAFIAAFAFEGC